MNQLNIICPYLWHGQWVFDDPNKGLDKEALVAGVPEMIEYATQKADIPNPQNGFIILFSKDKFPGADIELNLLSSDMEGGSFYEWKSIEQQCWLCPALFKYFDTAPDNLFIQVRSAPVMASQLDEVEILPDLDICPYRPTVNMLDMYSLADM